MLWFNSVFLLIFVWRISCYEKPEYRIGGLFSNLKQAVAFHTAANIMKEKYSFFPAALISDSINVPLDNTLEAYRGACKLLEKGIIGLFGPSSMYSSSHIQSLCDLKEIPHVETHQDLNLERNDTLVNIYPHPRILSYIFVDLVEAFNWNTLIVLYDNNENLLSVSAILELNLRGRNVVLRQFESEDADDENYRPMLNKVKLTGETKFIIACSIDILEQVLEQLQQLGMMTNMYSYIISNLDMQTIELSPFQYAGTNITGIRMINPEQIDVIRSAEEIQKQTSNNNGYENFGAIAAWKMRLETALVMDAVQLFFETIYSLIKDESMSINAMPIYCDSDDNWADGYTIINLMKTKTIEGLTGLVKFDVEGFRKDFNVDLIELLPGGLLKVGSWNSTTRVLTFQRLDGPIAEKEENLFNRTFTVLISIIPPYGMFTETTTQLVGNDRYEGFCIDVIEKLARNLGFNYTFIVQEDGANGNFNKTTNQWNGIIQKIIDGRADLAITDLTITSERENAVDFTMPFMNLGISILYRKPEPVPPSLFMFASPFSISVWIMLGVSYFVVSIAIFVMGRLSPREWQNPYPCVEEPEYLVNQFSIRNSLWFTIGALMQQGTELAPIAISTRTASGVWWFFVLIMVSSYTANLAAFLTVETLVTPFKDIYELAAQKEIKYGAKENGATANYFRDSNVTSYHSVWKHMLQHPEQMPKDNDEGVKKVESENYAFLMESTTIEYVTERHCSLAQVGGLLDDKGYGIAMKKESPYRNELSREVLKLQETGVLTGLKIKWWKEKRGGGKCSSKSEGGEATALDLQNVGGVFLVLFIGAILGLMGSFAELSLQVYRKAKTEKISFREELRKEMKFFLEFKKHVKEVKVKKEDSNENKLIE